MAESLSQDIIDVYFGRIASIVPTFTFSNCLGQLLKVMSLSLQLTLVFDPSAAVARILSPGC